jgi:hypothetical protein
VHEALRALHRHDAGGVLPACCKQQRRVIVNWLTGDCEMTPTMPHMD